MYKYISEISRSAVAENPYSVYNVYASFAGERVTAESERCRVTAAAAAVLFAFTSARSLCVAART